MWELLLGGAALIFGGMGLSVFWNKMKTKALDKVMAGSDEEHKVAVEKLVESNVVVAKLEQKLEDIDKQVKEVVDKPLDPSSEDLTKFFADIQKKMDNK